MSNSYAGLNAKIWFLNNARHLIVDRKNCFIIYIVAVLQTEID